MRGIRSKFIFVLIVYFAGFATAIYTLAPVPDDAKAVSRSGESFAWSALRSDEFAQRLNGHLHRGVDFIKEKGCEAGVYIKDKIEEHRSNS